MQRCSIEGCDNKKNSKDWCAKHYRRWQQHGDPLIILSNYGKSLRERFESKVELIPFSTCHWWTGATPGNIYGGIKDKGTMHAAHRVSYELYRETIPHGLYVLHKCDNPKCVNPDHLFLGTAQDNMDDMIKKGRQRYKPRSKVTAEEVLKIRKLHNGPQSTDKLALRFGLTPKSITNIINRRTWSHIASVIQ